MMKLAHTLVIVMIISYTQGQSLNNFDNSQKLGDVGIFNGRLVALDDVAQNNMNNIISGLGLPRERFFSGIVGIDNIDLSNGIDLRSMGFDLQGLGIGVSDLPTIVGQGRLGRMGNAQIGLGARVSSAIKSPKLRRCPRQGCTRQFIPARCRYTPVQRTLLGDYCLACSVNICESISPIGINGKSKGIKDKEDRTNRPRNNKNNKNRRQRQRNQRRRSRQEILCRMTGTCFGGARRSFGNDAIVFSGRRGPVRDLNNKNRFENVFSAANGGIGNLVGGIVGGIVENVGSAIQGLDNIVSNHPIRIRDLVGEGISGFPSVPARDIGIIGYDRRGRRGGLRRD